MAHGRLNTSPASAVSAPVFRRSWLAFILIPEIVPAVPARRSLSSPHNAAQYGINQSRLGIPRASSDRHPAS
jgi:hypothetical protein